MRRPRSFIGLLTVPLVVTSILMLVLSTPFSILAFSITLVLTVPAVLWSLGMRNRAAWVVVVAQLLIGLLFTILLLRRWH